MAKKSDVNRNPVTQKGGAQSTKQAAKKKINVKIPSKG
jgi:hypothetical protein